MFVFFSLSVSGKVTEGIFARNYHPDTIVIDVSGNSKQRINGTMQLTKPEYSIYPWDKRYDWCSNCGRSYDVKPWIAYSLKNKLIKISSYFIRCGCCYSGCCCEDEGYGCIDCCLYSWVLEISNDNKTWTEVHKVEKDDTMRRCNEKSYKLDKEYTAKFVRIVQTAPCPGWPPCIAINRFEVYGETVGDEFSAQDDFVSFHDDDEDVSIIGHISRNAHA